MTEKEAEKLIKDAQKYINDVVCIKKNFNGIEEIKEFIFIAIDGYKIDMSCYLNAILKEKNGHTKIKSISLHNVLEAMQNEEIIDYKRWF